MFLQMWSACTYRHVYIETMKVECTKDECPEALSWVGMRCLIISDLIIATSPQKKQEQVK